MFTYSYALVIPSKPSCFHIEYSVLIHKTLHCNLRNNFCLFFGTYLHYPSHLMGNNNFSSFFSILFVLSSFPSSFLPSFLPSFLSFLKFKTALSFQQQKVIVSFPYILLTEEDILGFRPYPSTNCFVVTKTLLLLSHCLRNPDACIVEEVMRIYCDM
jgi:hypothetical protein